VGRLFAPVEAIFEERAKHPVLLVDAVEESANMTVPGEIASGKLHGMILGFHIYHLITLIELRFHTRHRNHLHLTHFILCAPMALHASDISKRVILPEARDSLPNVFLLLA
jgi:hypothetical protein